MGQFLERLLMSLMIKHAWALEFIILCINFLASWSWVYFVKFLPADIVTIDYC
jgi:hypothetical protein